MGIFSRIFNSKKIEECKSALIASVLFTKLNEDEIDAVVSNIDGELSANNHPMNALEILKDEMYRVASYGLIADAIIALNLNTPNNFKLTYIRNPFALLTYSNDIWSEAILDLKLTHGIDVIKLYSEIK